MRVTAASKTGAQQDDVSPDMTPRPKTLPVFISGLNFGIVKNFGILKNGLTVIIPIAIMTTAPT